MKLTELLKKYVETNTRIQSKGTVQRYEATLIALGKYLEREPTTEDLNSDTYARWVIWRRDVCGVAPTTLHGEAQKLLVIWRWIARRPEYGVREPEVQLPRKFEPENTTWVEDGYSKLEKAGRECDWFVGSIPGKIYWPAFLGVAVESGERLGALHKLEAHHFDFTRLEVKFPAENRKGKTRDLTKQISLQTAIDVQALIAMRPIRPFAPLLQASMYHPYRRLLCDAGLPAGRSRLYHCLRRYHATQVHLRGGNAQRSLDHSDAKTTARYLDQRQLGPEPMPNRPNFLAPRRTLLARLSRLRFWRAG